MRLAPLAVASLLAVCPVAADDGEGSPPLTLDDCLRLARASHSAVNTAYHQATIAALGHTQARAAFFPQTRVTGAFKYNSPLKGSSNVQSYVALNGIREYITLFTVVEELDFSGRLRAARAIARANQEAAAVNLDIAERDLKHLLTASYYRLLLSRRLSRVAEDALQESRAFEARTKLLFEKGVAARADVVKAAAQAAFLEQAVGAAKLESQVANHELASFWTTDVAATLPLRDVLDDPLPDPPGPASELSAGNFFLRRPELTLLDLQRGGLRAAAKRARAELLPQGHVALQYGIDSLRWSWQDRGYAALFGIDIPVSDWFRGRSAARQLDAQAEQVQVSWRVAGRTFSKGYQDALSRVQTAHGQIATAPAQVQLSEEDLRLSRVRYDGGEGSALDVVTAQNQLAQARTNYYSAVVQYLVSGVDLRVASGE